MSMETRLLEDVVVDDWRMAERLDVGVDWYWLNGRLGGMVSALRFTGGDLDLIDDLLFLRDLALERKGMVAR